MSPRLHLSLPLFLLLVLITSERFFIVSSTGNLEATVIDEDLSSFYREIDDSISYTNVKNHLKTLTAFKSRVTGYEEFYDSAHYIRSIFNELGLTNVSSQEFEVAVPVSYGCNFTLTSTDESFTLYAVEPNLIVPSTTSAPIAGRVVYVGKGSYSDLEGKPLNGTIALMDFNSGLNWVNAAKFGAKAVVFIEPDHTTYQECSSKSIKAPFNFPRYYMTASSALRLLSELESDSPVMAQISSKVIWEEKQGLNIVGYVPGTADPEKIIMLSANYDSYSVAPELAPGANDATGIAVLLELARLSIEHPPPYTIMFVAFSGHHQGLAGARYFFEEYFWEGKHEDIGSRVILQLNLQLSTESSQLALTDYSSFYMFSMLYTPPQFRMQPEMFDSFVSYAEQLVDEINSALDSDFSLVNLALGAQAEAAYRSLIVRPNECEILALGNGPGFSLMTSASHHSIISPSDYFDNLDLSNLFFQVREIVSIIYGLQLQPSLLESKISALTQSTQDVGNITGVTAEYDLSSKEYTAVPNALLFIDRIGWYIRNQFVVKTDSEGRFTIPGLATGGVFAQPYRVLGFKLNETTGNPTYAPTFGRHKWREAPTSMFLGDVGYYALFRCATAVLFDLYYPFSQNLETVTTMLGTSTDVTLEIVDSLSYTEPEEFGYSSILPGHGFSMSVLFLPPNKNVHIVIGSSHLGDVPLGILINGSLSSPSGEGYRFDAGEQYVYYSTHLQIALDFYYRNRIFVNMFNTFGFGNESYVQNEKLKEAIDSSQATLENYSYGRAVTSSLEAWVEAQRLYSSLRSLLKNTSQVTIFFGAILIPFVFLLESLILSLRGKRKIAALLLLFAGFYVLFNTIHPAFTFSASPSLMVIGFSIIVLTLPSIAIVAANFQEYLNVLARRLRGKHFETLSRSATTILSYSLGIENMRKRRLRSFLVLLTIILITAGLTMFTSIASLTFTEPVKVPTVPSYKGVFIREERWSSIGLNVVDYLRSKYGGIARIVPHAWLYSWGAGSNLEKDWFKVSKVNSGRSAYSYAIQGSSTDPLLAAVSLIDGRWFEEFDSRVCIVSDIMAERLDAKVGDSLSFLDTDWVILGIVDTETFDQIRQIDGETLTPLDRTIEQNLVTHRSVSEIVIVPFHQLMQLAGYLSPYVSSVAVLPSDPALAEGIAYELFSKFDELIIYYSLEESVYIFSSSTAYQVLGLQLQIVPISLGALLILNLMLASVYERLREIFTLSSVGVSPFHIGFMFFAESNIYGLVGAVMGYIIAIAFFRFNLFLPVGTVFANWSTSGVVAIVGIITVITSAASIYPVIKASRLVTPSLERVWKVPVKPGERDWEIPFPFIVDESVAVGLFFYLREFVSSFTSEGGPFLVRKMDFRQEDKELIASMRVSLAPYESGVKQSVLVLLRHDEGMKKYVCSLHITRESGTRSDWIRLNRNFIDTFRKQLLFWNNLEASEKAEYVAKSQQMLKNQVAGKAR